jgi:hypothetical protein
VVLAISVEAIGAQVDSSATGRSRSDDDRIGSIPTSA